MPDKLLRAMQEITVVVQNHNFYPAPFDKICGVISEETMATVRLIADNGSCMASWGLVSDAAVKLEIPLKYRGISIAVLTAYKQGEFSLDDLILLESASWALSILAVNVVQRENDEKARKVSVVKSAIDTLSFSELEAVLHVFAELGSLEGLVVASRIAEKAKITRSVIVSALRKLESAGVLESHSLGMKGTHIKVLNEIFIDELNKLRA